MWIKLEKLEYLKNITFIDDNAHISSFNMDLITAYYGETSIYKFPVLVIKIFNTVYEPINIMDIDSEMVKGFFKNLSSKRLDTRIINTYSNDLDLNKVSSNILSYKKKKLSFEHVSSQLRILCEIRFHKFLEDLLYDFKQDLDIDRIESKYKFLRIMEERHNAEF